MKKNISVLALSLLLANSSFAQNKRNCFAVKDAEIAIKESLAHIENKKLFLGSARSDEKNNTFTFAYFMQQDKLTASMGELVVEKDSCLVDGRGSSVYDIDLLVK